MPADITSTIPVLASLNLQESIDFCGKLGFRELGRWPDYAIVARDGAEVHFWLCDDRRIAEHTSCYVRVADTSRLFDEFRRNGLPVREPELRPWGMKELYVIDPHGNLFKFGERV